MKNYPKWIDEYALSMQQGFSHMVPVHWSSIDGYKVITCLQGAFLSRMSELVDKHQTAKTPINRLWNLFSNPSSLRSAISFLALEYQDLEDKERLAPAARKVFDFLVEILYYGTKEDAWAFDRNKIHSADEIKETLARVPWTEATLDTARLAGQLYVSAASVCFSLYRDFFPQDAHEVFGPYDASAKFGAGAIMVIKSFSKMKPGELWPGAPDFPWSTIRIYHVMRDVSFKCEIMGMHSTYDKPVIPNTIALAVEIDGKFIGPEEIKNVSDAISGLATEYSGLYGALSPAEKRKKFLEWECYQFVDLFKAVGMDWRPTESMLATIENAEIPEGVDMTCCPSLEELMTSKNYEVYWLKKLYGVS